MNKSTIGFKIRNHNVELKEICYQCRYVNPNGTGRYKCAVAGQCPAVAIRPKPALLSPVSFAIGTEVLVKEKRRRPTGKNIVTDVSISSGCLQYAVNGCAWFDHDELDYIASATTENVEEAIRTNQEEEEGDEDFEDDEDDGDD